MQELHSLFRDFASSSPAKRGEDMMALFQSIEGRGGNFVRKGFDTMLEVLELPSDHPMAQAGKEIADLIDSRGASKNYGGHGNSYHNPDHMFEVPTAGTGIILIHDARAYEPKLPGSEKLILLVAFLAHDLGHNGKGNGFGENRVPLLTEREAIELAKPIIRKHYESAGMLPQFEKDFFRYEAIVTATDIIGGEKAPGKFFEDYAKYHRGELPAPPAPPMPELEKFAPLLQSDPTLSHSCVIMKDADLLPSIGLTLGWAEKQDFRFTQEMTNGKSTWIGMDPENALFFYDNIARLGSQAGREFQSNFSVIRQHAHRLCSEINEFKMSG